MEAKVVFLFGKSGAGKSFVGDIIGDLLGWHVYHADEDFTEEMKIALAERRPFTDDMRDQYFAIVVDKTLSLMQIHKRIVVTQGAYKQRHRNYLYSK